MARTAKGSGVLGVSSEDSVLVDETVDGRKLRAPFFEACIILGLAQSDDICITTGSLLEVEIQVHVDD